MIYIAGDKHGLKAIQIVEEYLKAHDIKFKNLGIKSRSEDMRLEEMIPRVIKKVLEGAKNQGILSCGTGMGVDVGANRFSGIRACLAQDEKMAEWSRVYDDCNVLCLSGWQLSKTQIRKMLDAWFKAKYDGSRKRLKMFKAFDRWH